MIISFTSYRDGAGTSTLCANMAAYLCKHQNKKVLLWDFDVYSPSLHYYFGKLDNDISVDGTLEIFANFMESVHFDEIKDVSKIVNKFEGLNLHSQTNGGIIDLLPAGYYASMDYYDRAEEIFWYGMARTTDLEGYAEVLKKEIKLLGYDYILIDSGSGINTKNTISNVYLADVNVVPMFPDIKSFVGNKRLINNLIYKNGDIGKKNKILPILSKLDTHDPIKSEYWKDLFSEYFAFCLMCFDFYKQLDTSELKNIFTTEYIPSTFLQYNSNLAFGENIIFNNDNNIVGRDILNRNVYRNIFNLIAK